MKVTASRQNMNHEWTQGFTHIFESPDEVLLAVHPELGAPGVVAPPCDVVHEGPEPGLGVRGVDVGRVLQGLHQGLHVTLDLGVAVVQLTAHHNLQVGIWNFCQDGGRHAANSKQIESDE